ncbi:PRC-barrel domain-containing protein [Halomonas garicola]|uniref:PRC-barrel domain-containing protein n=1 Tax=Halomonas garicola TaxID=1690008 RepID=UPI00289C9248|nr:PRC-barrel domain-containing protein [Halomonas garicola]
MRKNTLMTALGVSVLSFTLGAQAQSGQPQEQTGPQGMYSADNILDADVYVVNGSGDPIGEVEDILFDEEMKVSALVVESGEVLGLGGRELVVGSNYFTLETYTEQDDDDINDTEHRVMVDATSEEMEQFPAYNNDWWKQAKSNARDAWQTTEEGAKSAWQTTQEGAQNAWQKTKDAASDMGNDGVDNRNDDMGNRNN